MKKLLSTLALATLTAWASQASADINKLRTHEGNQAGAVPTTLQIDGASTFIDFTAVKAFAAITFSAECLMNGPGSWVDIDVTVADLTTGAAPVEASPSNGNSDAFCSDQSSFVTASRTVKALLTVGHVYRVRVNVSNGGGNGPWWIGDSATMIQE